MQRVSARREALAKRRVSEAAEWKDLVGSRTRCRAKRDVGERPNEVRKRRGAEVVAGNDE